MLRTLVVDDDPDVRFTVRVALEGARSPDDEPLQVVEAADGEEALAAVGAARFDVVVLDLMLPGVDGAKVLQSIRRRHGGDVAVIMLTARGRESDVAAAFRAGADAYLTKPFDIDELTRLTLELPELSAADRRLRRERELERAELLLQLEQSFDDLPLEDDLPMED